MAKEMIMSKTNAKIIAAGAGTAALAATTAYICGRKKPAKNDKDKVYVLCPVCSVLVDKNQKKCNCCGSPLQICASCGSLFHGVARHCPKCGTESMTGGTVTVMGITYRPPISEPFPTDHASHTYCCCGTPFVENAKYCQLCGRKRPKPEHII